MIEIKMKLKEISYPIISKSKGKNFITIKAGKKWTGESKIINYEGVELRLPTKTENYNELIFVITSVKEANSDKYSFSLHTHEGKCCELDGEMIISKETLGKFTRLPTKEIRYALEKVSLGNTYNLLASLPMKIILVENEVRIYINKNPKLVNSMNFCQNLFKDKHPIDR